MWYGSYNTCRNLNSKIFSITFDLSSVVLLRSLGVESRYQEYEPDVVLVVVLTNFMSTDPGEGLND